MTVFPSPSGNGPSGICLSYLLSGYTPYLDPETIHPNPILYQKLQEAKHLPITEQVGNTKTLFLAPCVRGAELVWAVTQSAIIGDSMGQL